MGKKSALKKSAKKKAPAKKSKPLIVVPTKADKEAAAKKKAASKKAPAKKAVARKTAEIKSKDPAADKPLDLSTLTQPIGQILVVRNSGVLPIPMQVDGRKEWLGPNQKVFTMGISTSSSELEFQCIYCPGQDGKQSKAIAKESAIKLTMKPGLVIASQDSNMFK